MFAAQAQPLALLQGKLVTQDGKAITNQPIVIEGRQDGWLPFWFTWGTREHKVVSVTNRDGGFQVINLPAGQYTLKMLRPGTEPIPIKSFTLDPGYSKKDVTGSVPSDLGFE
jgi:hypothetical protein